MAHSKHIIGPVEARFWPKVNKTDTCWLWTASKTPKGYGRFNCGNGKYRLAHQVSWFIHHGEWPNLCVLHKCDVPACVNPEHMFLGTLFENNEDMRQKGRKYSKLKADQIPEIRQAIASGKPMNIIAQEFNVSHGLICHIKHGRSWVGR